MQSDNCNILSITSGEQNNCCHFSKYNRLEKITLSRFARLFEFANLRRDLRERSNHSKKKKHCYQRSSKCWISCPSSKWSVVTRLLFFNPPLQLLCCVLSDQWTQNQSSGIKQSHISRLEILSDSRWTHFRGLYRFTERLQSPNIIDSWSNDYDLLIIAYIIY